MENSTENTLPTTDDKLADVIKHVRMVVSLHAPWYKSECQCHMCGLTRSIESYVTT